MNWNFTRVLFGIEQSISESEPKRSILSDRFDNCSASKASLLPNASPFKRRVVDKTQTKTYFTPFLLVDFFNVVISYDSSYVTAHV
jgi:hypothetical protein